MKRSMCGDYGESFSRELSSLCNKDTKWGEAIQACPVQECLQPERASEGCTSGCIGENAWLIQHQCFQKGVKASQRSLCGKTFSKNFFLM